MLKHKKHHHHRKIRIQFLLNEIPRKKESEVKNGATEIIGVSKGRLFPERKAPSSYSGAQSKALPTRLFPERRTYSVSNAESSSLMSSGLYPEGITYDESATESSLMSSGLNPESLTYAESATESSLMNSGLYPESITYAESATESSSLVSTDLFTETEIDNLESVTQSNWSSRLFPERKAATMEFDTLTMDEPVLETELSLDDVTTTNRANRNSTKSSILLTTSIAPVQIEKQRKAIDTWINAGFDVVSLNTSEEVSILKPYFPDIDFEIMNRSAISQYGKPYIYIYDFMQYLIKQDYKVYGIINSDIHFKDIKNDFVKFIYNHAQDSLVYGHRTDVTNLNEKSGTVSNGVDYFFFNKKIASVYEDEGMCMGQPAWDWWMVCVPAAKGFKTNRLLSNNAYHVIHPQAWDQSLNQHLIETIVLNKHLKSVYPDLSPLDLNTKMWSIVITDQGIRYGSN